MSVISRVSPIVSRYGVAGTALSKGTSRIVQVVSRDASLGVGIASAQDYDGQ